MTPNVETIPGFLFFDHVAVSVRQGELEAQVAAYKAMGFQELHREDVLGTDQVREVLLQVGDGPNLVQLLEPLSAASPVAKQIEKNGGRGGLARGGGGEKVVVGMVAGREPERGVQVHHQRLARLQFPVGGRGAGAAH